MPGLDMMNQQRPDDQEAAMARADLYKLANYSFKLFKMIKDGDQLEGWVQAKVTKAADYIASVYHYLEYEMKFSEYGSKLENSDVYSEAVQKMYARKLTEAKVMLDKMKERAMKAEELGEGWDEMQADVKKRAAEKGTGKFDVKKTSTGTQYTRKSSTFDDGGKDSDHKKAEKKSKGVKEGSIQGGVWTADAPKKGAPNVPVPSPDEGPTANVKKPTTPLKKPVAGAKPAVAPVKEGKKPDFLDMDKDGNKKEPMKKAIADKKKNPFAKVKEAEEKCNHTAKGKSCPVHGMKECSGMYEASHQEKTTMKHVKNPTAGEKAAAKDIKPGVKGYADRIAMLKSAEKDGRLKTEALKGKQSKLDVDKDGKLEKSDFKKLRAK